jgi:Xaa-Pro dipeptidase
MELYRERIERLQQKMQQEELDLTVLGPSANMFYFSGMRTSPDERLQVLLIPAAGQPVAVFPQMYRKQAETSLTSLYEIRDWADSQDPLRVVSTALGGRKPRRVVVDDTLWSCHLVSLLGVFDDVPSLATVSALAGSLRLYKDRHELELLRQAGEAADQVMEKVRDSIRPGMTERQLGAFIENAYRDLADDISFKPIVASGPHSASPHHSTGTRAFAKGDFVVVDCGGLVGGYCSDITRTFCLGQADEEMRQVYKAVMEANQAAYEAVGKGCSGEEADAAARSVITNAGYGPRFIHRTGHGIGLEVHEAPYLVDGNREELASGMVFSIEPGIYLDGSFGVRIEDIVALTEDGAEQLNRFPRELIEII